MKNESENFPGWDFGDKLMKNYKISYKLDSTNYIVYDSLSEDPDVKVLSASLSLEENNAGSLSFSLPSTHPVKGIFTLFAGTIYVYENGELIWTGRITSKDEDFYGQVSFECEGAFAFLNDTHQESAVYENYSLENFINKLLTKHNSKVSSDRKIYLGTITVDDGQKNRYSEYEQTLEALNDILTDTKGHFQIRYASYMGEMVPYLDYLASYNPENSQYINFGENLLDYSRSYGAEDFATVVLPLGKEDDQGNRLTIESVNDGSKYLVNQTMVNNYGWIEVMYDDSSIETAAVLKSNAQKVLTNAIVQNSEIDVSAIDLSVLDNNLQEIKLLDQVRVISKPNNVNALFPVKALEKDLTNPANDTFSLGSTVTDSISTRSANAQTELKKAIENLPSEEAIETKASELIKSATSGYITIKQNTSGATNFAEEFIISDNKDYTQATKIWRWNINGFGYSSTGYSGTYGLAITMDGEIVADYVTTGTLRSKNGNTSWNLNDGTFTMKKGSIEIGSNFSVDSSGNMTAKHANLTGNVVAGTVNGYFVYLDTQGAIYMGEQWDPEDAFGSWTCSIHGNIRIGSQAPYLNGLGITTRTDLTSTDYDDGIFCLTSMYLGVRNDSSDGFSIAPSDQTISVVVNGVSTNLRFINGILVTTV